LHQRRLLIATEVFAGNTKIDATVADKINEIKKTYGITKFTFVGDRGMLTKSNLDYAQKQDINFITAL